MLRQEFSHPQRVLVVALHANGECLYSAKQKKGTVGIHVAAEGCAGFMDLVDQILSAAHDAADQVTVTRKILGARVHDEIDTELRGTRVYRGSEGTVHHRDQVVFARDPGDAVQVDNPQRGVGG